LKLFESRLFYACLTQFYNSVQRKEGKNSHLKSEFPPNILSKSFKSNLKTDSFYNCLTHFFKNISVLFSLKIKETAKYNSRDGDENHKN